MDHSERPRPERGYPIKLRRRRRLQIPRPEEDPLWRIGEEDPDATRVRHHLHRFFEELLRRSEH